MQTYFLWPKCSVLKALWYMYQMKPIVVIENHLREMFPSGYPVLCSSGRAALNLVLTQKGANRGDFVGVFPFASHCVLDSISRIATPLCGPTSLEASLRVVYHQWGFVQEEFLSSNSIEDCVDTLCLPGTKLFPGGGGYEIWSLPKILGTSSGGVLWCRDKDAADAIKAKRDQRGGGFLGWVMRLLGYQFPSTQKYWHGTESSIGGVSLLQTGEILHAIKNWDMVVKDRIIKLEMVWPYAVKWLQKPHNRLPPVVPVECTLTDEEVLECGISTGYRMFERVDKYGGRQLIKTLPIPIHQDISLDKFAFMITQINRSKRV
jgi:putative PLP-dependent aminotransferase (TIGR04422 family)